MQIPISVLCSIKQPSSPSVTITNLTFGNLKSMERRALGIEEASVHSCKSINIQFPYQSITKRTDVNENSSKLACK